VYGLDVAQSAVDYVCGELNLPACRAPLETFDPMQEFGIDGFDAVTLWFVIEHFDNAGAVLKKLNTLLKKGGILAFSTPSAAGISAQSDPQRFFETSPHDHHTLWSPKTAAAVLSRFGFRVVKIVSTGHHPERFPEVKKHPHNFLTVKTAAVASRLLKLGDTFEVYCIKESGEVHLN
jgi:2-polyprenyl-3-methyl-5-hydroxy-6-metoxy-1,4-benzoquinol methylase